MQLANGVMPCCKGYGEHFDWCELGQLETLLRRRGQLADGHPATAAYEALLDSYDRDDVERDRADDYRLAVGE